MVPSCPYNCIVKTWLKPKNLHLQSHYSLCTFKNCQREGHGQCRRALHQQVNQSWPEVDLPNSTGHTTAHSQILPVAAHVEDPGVNRAPFCESAQNICTHKSKRSAHLKKFVEKENNFHNLLKAWKTVKRRKSFTSLYHGKQQSRVRDPISPLKIPCGFRDQHR